LSQNGVKFEEYDLPYLKTQNGVADMGDGTMGSWFKDPGGNIVGVVQMSPQAQQRMQSEMSMAGAGSGMGGGMR
jgi:hypothetical protein